MVEIVASVDTVEMVEIEEKVAPLKIKVVVEKVE